MFFKYHDQYANATSSLGRAPTDLHGGRQPRHPVRGSDRHSLGMGLMSNRFHAFDMQDRTTLGRALALFIRACKAEPGSDEDKPYLVTAVALAKELAKQ